jgi:hypothetical protein
MSTGGLHQMDVNAPEAQAAVQVDSFLIPFVLFAD